MHASAPPAPSLRHRLEVLARTLLGWLLGLLLWRPRRGLWAAGLLGGARRVVLVRVDHRVGEALLLTPLVAALRGRFEIELLVHPRCVRVLEGLAGVSRVRPFERRWLALGPFGGELRRLRRELAGAVVVNAGNWSEYSGTAALTARLVGAHACVVGPAVGPGALLMDVPVRARPDTDGEIHQRLALLAPLAAAQGLSALEGRMGFREPRPTASIEAFAQALGRPWVVVNPGGRLGERRVPPAVFRVACLAIAARGLVPVVTWGPGEGGLAAETAAGVPQAVIAPPTSIDDLAWLMRGARFVVCNNTGPMHLAVAVGAPTLALFFRVPVSRWGHPGAEHAMVDLTGCPDTATAAAVVQGALARFPAAASSVPFSPAFVPLPSHARA